MTSLPASWIVVGVLLIVITVIALIVCGVKWREAAALKKEVVELRDTMRMMRYEEANLSRMLHTVSKQPVDMPEEFVEEETAEETVEETSEAAVEDTVAVVAAETIAEVVEETIEEPIEECVEEVNEEPTEESILEESPEETPVAEEETIEEETIEEESTEEEIVAAEEEIVAAEEESVEEPAAEETVEDIPEEALIEEIPAEEEPVIEEAAAVEEAVEESVSEVPAPELVEEYIDPKPRKQAINERRPAIPTDLFAAWFEENEPIEPPTNKNEVAAVEVEPVTPVVEDAHQVAEIEGEELSALAEEDDTEELSELSKEDERFRRKLERIVNARMRNPNLNVDIIASQFGMGRTNFYRKVRELMGMSPNDYLRKCRMERAAELLQSSDQNIGEICGMVGIPDAQYFSRVFKSYFGVPPSSYREQND